jgi:hypothetical protein
MLAGLEIQRVATSHMARAAQGPRLGLADTNRQCCRRCHGPVYGPAARQEARQFMREAKRQKINLG